MRCEQTIGPTRRRRRCKRPAQVRGMCRMHAQIEEHLHRAWSAEALAAKARGRKTWPGIIIRTGEPVVVKL